MQSPQSKPDLLSSLLERNKWWAARMRRISPNFFGGSAGGQAPKVLWIGCSDSRVPENAIMDCAPGDIFVYRNIANQFPPNDDAALSILSFAVENLGVEHIIVAGHSGCGGVAAALEIATGGPPDSPPEPRAYDPDRDIAPYQDPGCALRRWITPIIQHAESLCPSLDRNAIDRLVAANVAKQVEEVVASAVVRRAWADHCADPAARQRVEVHGWVYELGTGHLRDLQVSKAPPC